MPPTKPALEVARELAAVKQCFRGLRDWRIRVDGNSVYKGQVSITLRQKEAVIYDWPDDAQRPADFLLHELLHIAVRRLHSSVRNARDREEEFIQDVCALIERERREAVETARPEIERKAISKWYAEGQGIIQEGEGDA